MSNKSNQILIFCFFLSSFFVKMILCNNFFYSKIHSVNSEIHPDKSSRSAEGLKNFIPRCDFISWKKKTGNNPDRKDYKWNQIRLPFICVNDQNSNYPLIPIYKMKMVFQV
jgi:hypothetical protein